MREVLLSSVIILISQVKGCGTVKLSNSSKSGRTRNGDSNRNMLGSGNSLNKYDLLSN